MKLKTTLIGLGLISSLALQGCYTQLAMFHPEPVYDQDGEGQFYDTYSEAPLRPGLQGYAQDGSSAMPLGYSNMQNRFNPFFGYGGLNYYNPYYYNGYGGGYGYGYGYNYYGYSHTIGGYNMFIPVGETKTMRYFNKDRLATSGTNLRVTRSSASTRSSNWNSSSSWTNSSNISTTRSSSSSSASSSSSSSKSSGGRRATRRN